MIIVPRQFFPTPEAQRREYEIDERRFIFDNMGCVSEAVENKVAYRLTKKIENKMIPEEDVTWLREGGFFDKNGKINFSGRELAKRSGTTRKGNYGWKVAQTAANGLVAESLYPWPEPGQDQRVTWEEYYSPFPDEVVEQREEFEKRFSISYGWVRKRNFYTKFKNGIPLIFFVYAWVANENKYNGLYYRPAGESSNHGVLGVGGEKDGADWSKFAIFDTYPPFEKELHPDNVDEWAIEMDIISNNNFMDIEQFKKDNVNNLIRNRDTGAYGVIYETEEGNLSLYHVTPSRAGIFMVDRDARGAIGEHEKKEVDNTEWELLKPVKF